MDTTVDYYEVLGVPITADRSEVKAAWSSLVQKYHPDMGAEGDAKKFMEVQKAYEILSDEDKRIQYDAARDALNPPAAPQDMAEAYTPGWGEAADASVRAAAPTNPNGRRKTREWVPPHMREQTPPRDEPAPKEKPAPKPKKPAGERTPRPKPHESWRTAANSEIKPKVTRGWKSLWLPPVVAGILSLITGLISFSTAPVNGMLGAITPVFVLVLATAAIIGVVIDWSRIQSGRDTVLGLGIAGIATLGVIVLGFGTENYPLIATGVLTGVWVGHLLNSLRYKYVTTRSMPAKELTNFVAYGKPGRYAPAQVLQYVERDLAERLSQLFIIPSVRLFNGLFVPASKRNVQEGEAVATKFGATVVNGGYIGQAVTAGKKAAFLTSVVWPAGHYTLDSYGSVLINGQHTQYELDAFEADAKNWKRTLKGAADARFMIVVHADGPVSFDIPNRDVELVSVTDLIDTLGSWMVDDQDHLDRELNAVLSEHLATS